MDEQSHLHCGVHRNHGIDPGAGADGCLHSRVIFGARKKDCLGPNREALRLRASRGITLTEVLVVTAVVAVLSALGYSATSPAREKARQVVCISQLKQIYAAVALYSADHEGAAGMPLHPNIAFIYGDLHDALRPYLKGSIQRVLFCPDFPERKIGKLSSSYEFRWLAFTPRPPGDDDAWYESLERDLRQRPDTYPMVICRTHDDEYYSRVEAGMDGVTVGAYTIELRFDGSVHSGLRTSPRKPRR